MSEEKVIPEDLKRTYEDCKQYSLSLGDFGETVDGMVVRLIERIGRDEAALKHIADDGMDAQMCMITARSALAAHSN